MLLHAVLNRNGSEFGTVGIPLLTSSCRAALKGRTTAIPVGFGVLKSRMGSFICTRKPDKIALKNRIAQSTFLKRQRLALGGFSLCARQVRHCAPRASDLGRSWVKKKPLTARWMIDARVFAR
jgi:hypothetical protein